MTLVIDASVAAKWVLSEAGEEAAESLLLRESYRLAPDFLLVEIANILRTKRMRQQIDETQMHSSFAFVKSSVHRFVPDGRLARRALEIAAECGHSVYDCMYVACAEQEQTQVVTADARFINKLRATAFDRLVQPLNV